MAESDVRVPAGWYPDPLGLPQLRWWDNHAWTEYTSDARQPMVAHETVTAQPRLAYADDEDHLTRRERRERETAGGDAFATGLQDLLAEDAAPATDASGSTGQPEPAKPAAEALLSLEAPKQEEAAEEGEDLLSPAAMFADIAPSNAPTTPAYNLDTRFDDLLGTPQPQTPVSAFSHVNESASGFAQPGVPQFAGFDMPAAGAYDMPAPGAPAATPAAQPGHLAGHDLSVSSGAAWAIAFLPLISLLLGMFFLLSNMAGGLASTLFAVFLAVVPYLAGVLFAWLDRRTLIRKGHEHPAHWAIAFAGAPIYLIARFASVVRRSGRGFGPLVSWAGLAAMAAAAVLAVPGLAMSLAPASFAASAEEGIVRQAQALGADLVVNCPDVPPMIVGSTMQCLAKTEGDPVSWGIDVALARESGWIVWNVIDWGIFKTPELGE
ncbi:DUF2510 domain-containing protein [Homoserinibacter sp. YIM 151385]|uniref:DUF2510 domain-containing protein n=1 Tax=Homoserinibacter sp. YIM 151385 TaxID=2985506 RepID=UPI0022F069F7|nr:DUF2510 domain-containing protein [Homoserinibacter sp. YIM 151385]WBU38380.1 DUF2510 domain-containing protein [Homoserinibacter sp. YIM 151385]